MFLSKNNKKRCPKLSEKLLSVYSCFEGVQMKLKKLFKGNDNF